MSLPPESIMLTWKVLPTVCSELAGVTERLTGPDELTVVDTVGGASVPGGVPKLEPGVGGLGWAGWACWWSCTRRLAGALCAG